MIRAYFNLNVSNNSDWVLCSSVEYSTNQLFQHNGKWLDFDHIWFLIFSFACLFYFTKCENRISPSDYAMNVTIVQNVCSKFYAIEVHSISSYLNVCYIHRRHKLFTPSNKRLCEHKGFIIMKCLLRLCVPCVFVERETWLWFQ